MAAIAIVMGSVLGFFGAILGLVFFDMGLMAAFALYLGTSLGCGLLAVLSSVACADRAEQAFAQPARG